MSLAGRKRHCFLCCFQSARWHALSQYTTTRHLPQRPPLMVRAFSPRPSVRVFLMGCRQCLHKQAPSTLHSRQNPPHGTIFSQLWHCNASVEVVLPSEAEPWQSNNLNSRSNGMLGSVLGELFCFPLLDNICFLRISDVKVASRCPAIHLYYIHNEYNVVSSAGGWLSTCGGLDLDK